MDTSETYIKMCDCEVQEEFRLRQLDKEYLENSYWYEGRWLPRQDQLQEMFDSTKYSTFRNYFFFHDWIEDNVLDDDYQPKPEYENCSYEQLWLAFVMKEKYNKTWNGEDWKEKS